VADYRASRPGLREIDPIEAVEEAMDHYDYAISELALLGRRPTTTGRGSARSKAA
jgi:hypothetical protein